ncbi:MAG: O-antigen polymerase, partial [Thiomonas sp.]
MSVTPSHPRQIPGGLNNRRITPALPAENRTETADWAGAELYSILKLLALPALFILSILVFKLHPGKLGLYGFALIFGLFLLVQLRKGPEPLLALVIIYYPLSKLYPVLIAPGINGTNLLELFLISFWVIHAYKNKKKMFNPLPFTRLVGIWFLLSVISVFTAILRIGLHPFIWNYLLSVRGFFDQFIIFFLVVNLIQDKNMARRLIVYMMFSAAVIFLYGIQEWWFTRGASSIEKSRLLGPIGQPNEFAAQTIYSLAPLLAYGAYYFPRWKSWRLAPIVLIGLKVLLAAFSRGAYLAFAM